jgi:hypothetical protein
MVAVGARGFGRGDEAVALDLAQGGAHRGRHAGKPRLGARLGVHRFDLLDEPGALGGEVLTVGLQKETTQKKRD